MDPFHQGEFADWPLVVIRLRRPPVADSEIGEFQEWFLDLLELAKTGDGEVIKPGKLRLLMQLDGIVAATPLQIVSAASFIGKVQAYLDCIEATALVVTSDRARHILNQIVPLLRSVNATFDNEADAKSWLLPA